MWTCALFIHNVPFWQAGEPSYYWQPERFDLPMACPPGGRRTTVGRGRLRKVEDSLNQAPMSYLGNPDSLRLKVRALTDFLRSNKIEVLNVAGPRESKETGVYERTPDQVLLRGKGK